MMLSTCVFKGSGPLSLTTELCYSSSRAPVLMHVCSLFTIGKLSRVTSCMVMVSQSDDRRAAYGCDVTYVTNSELGFDYLRDNLATVGLTVAHDARADL